MKKFIFILILLGIVKIYYAQAMLIWSKDYNTELLNYYSEHPKMNVDGDTIIIHGSKNTIGGQRLQIVKYNLEGDTISTHTYGNDSVYNSTLIDYQFDSSDHVYLLQKEQLEFYKSKIVLQKYSLDGSLIWIEQIQNIADTSYTPYSLGLINDSCIFISVYKEYDYPEPDDDVIFTKTFAYLFAYNSNGNPIWQRAFDPDTEIDRFNYDIFVYNNTAFLFVNNTSFINQLLKIDINNNLLVNIDTEIIAGINDVQITPDNYLLITDMLWYRISKYDLNGDLIWAQNYETNLPDNVGADKINSVIQDSIGNIYLTGKHYGLYYDTPDYTGADILTLKYDMNGNLIWQNRYIYDTNNVDIGKTIKLKGGNIYVGGQSQRLSVSTDYDYVVIKMDTGSGITNGIYRYNGIENGDDVVSSLHIFDNGNVAITGVGFLDPQYGWTTQLLSDIYLSAQNFESAIDLEVYPNPVNSGDIVMIKGYLYQEYSIISSVGQVVQNGKLDMNDIQTISLDDINPGLYVLYLITDRATMQRKIILK